jgi:anti-anti-sigma regulatory factor
MTDPLAVEPLPQSLELIAAEPLCRKLQDKLHSARPILLDGSRVERISTPCLQILVAASKSAQARGVSFELRSPSKVLLDALADLGLEQALTRSDM